MKEQKTSKQRRSYEPEFKGEILKMLVSGRKVSEIAETFGIAEKRYAVAAAVSLENLSDNEDKDELEQIKGFLRQFETGC